jgi:type I restriction enzyme, S subunit
MSWKKVRLGDILKQYRIEHRVDDKTTYKQVSILNDGSVVLRGEKIGKDIGRKRQFIIDTKRYPNTLIFTRQLLLQGSIGIASHNVHNCIATENMPMFSIDTEQIEKEFLILFLKSEVFKSRIRDIELSGSAQKSIHERTFLNLEFLLPSFELQKGIVMQLLKLESNSDNISTELTHQLTLVKKLRQQLLQDAVQGKLVAQNEKDEPASELLKKIKAEKAKLIAEKKLKKEKELPPLKPSDIPFEIPENWVWCRLGEISLTISTGPFGTMLHKSDYVKNGIPLVNPTNIVNEKIIASNKMMINEQTKARLKSYVLNDGDVVMGRRGEMGRCAVVTENESGWLCGTGSFFLRLHIEIYRPYFVKVLGTEFAKSFLLGSSVGSTMNNLNHKILSNLSFPLPPLAEQNRIVQKLDELMQYCNELEVSIKQSESQNEKLMQQVLREALWKEPVEV